VLGYLQVLWASRTLSVGSSGFNVLTCANYTGGLIPMLPYFAMKNVTHALFVSIGITVIILLLFGYAKNYVTVGTKRSGAYGAVQTLFVGALAAATSYGIVRAIDSKSPVSTQ
jgi:VIT1/CCC1 family predicted Fe2+/Mn2+ transporter